jgi:hypothetical protein
MVIWVLLFSTTFSSEAEEIKFLKIEQMNAQEEMGSAIMESSRLAWKRGLAQERLGQIIRDAGPQGKFDQPLLGKGIAEAAHLKWQAGAAEEAVGSAIVKASMIVSKKAAITGKEAIQERLGAMIQAKAQREWAASEEAKSFAAARAAALQDEEGRTIQKTAQLRWAEGVMADTVQAALGSLPSETAPATSEALSVIRTNVGFGPEENLRLAWLLLEEEKGAPLTEILPAPVVIGAAGPVTYTVVGWEKGLGTFASLFGFAWAMAMFSWALTDPDRARIVRTRIVMEKVEKPAGVTFLKAA